ncbi:uncharacterized protein B0H18DRAFT_982501 [Fomitopsis serialis]|uniref:uncharacterized protein n=1 Tax=Fomitopsis serialis TaxID=139415 RepID=UPI00200787F9|nr:uncharacterized protein B0H18DRAFT_982501 [Neoantrodia serialis]KAH9933885.1 hypothetical protein B0H18DRAFT_982501 [Neoantrodia serialis]
MERPKSIYDYYDPYYDTLSSCSSAPHEQLETELLGNIKYDDPSVFTRLRIYEEDNATIDRCHERYQAEHERNIKTLQSVTRDAEEALSYIGDIQEAWTREKVRRHLEHEHEVEMYGPLRRIFEFLTGFGSDTSGALREFRFAADTPFSWPPARAAEAYTPGIANLRPDFILLNRTHHRPFWDDCVGFAEIKVTADGNDPSSDEDDVKPAILQCADYARYHLSIRPFWNFSVALLITGTVFRVLIADRGGILLSPVHSIIDDGTISDRDPRPQRDAKTFVRVVRALTRRLTDHQLGQDPSVMPVSRDDLESYLRLSSLPNATRDGIHVNGADYYRSYRINPFVNDTRLWCTIGPPIWTSLSLLGRGTVVWRVLQLSESTDGLTFQGDIHVMKSSWRNPHRMSETDVYRLIDQLEDCPRGVAKMLYGGDVYYLSENPQTWAKITVARIRGGADSDDPNYPSKVLHRIILPRVGEPLWRYTNELQLLYAFRAIIEAHQYLCKQGIQHHDITPGNLLLWLNEPPLLPDAKHRDKLARGFLADFDMATVDKPQVLTDSRVQLRINHTSSLCNMPVTGSLQFMAWELLRGLHVGGDIHHTPEHDLESIAYVLGYTICCHLLNTPGCPDGLKQSFQECFGAMTLKDLCFQRNSLQPLAWLHSIPHHDQQRLSFTVKHVSKPLAYALVDIEFKLQQVHRVTADQHCAISMHAMYNVPIPSQQPLDEVFNHEIFLKLLDNAISELEQHP